MSTRAARIASHPHGGPIAQLNPFFNRTQFVYDARNRATDEYLADPDGRRQRDPSAHAVRL